MSTSTRPLSTAAQRTTYRTLHRTTLAAPALRRGLTARGAARAAPHLRALLSVPALALCDAERLLAWDGQGRGHAADAYPHAAQAMVKGRRTVRHGVTGDCAEPGCPVRAVVAAPLLVEDAAVGALVAFAHDDTPDLVRATGELAGWVSGQLALAELDSSRTRLIEAELAALRSQISPHFVYNTLTAIASFVRTDPDRSRELLLAFAEFTRYSLRRGADVTTLADELRSVDQYLELERARFGERLHVTLQVSPDVLAVAVPFLCLQPLVENAVRHGLEAGPGPCHIRLRAEDRGGEAVISVEDDGAGMPPERVRAVLAGEVPGAVGLFNVDARLRRVYGAEYGLALESALGAGTRVALRIPRDAARGVR